MKVRRSFFAHARLLDFLLFSANSPELVVPFMPRPETEVVRRSEVTIVLSKKVHRMFSFEKMADLG